MGGGRGEGGGKENKKWEWELEAQSLLLQRAYDFGKERRGHPN